jgi:hypothetical protein
MGTALIVVGHSLITTLKMSFSTMGLVELSGLLQFP